MNAQSMERLSMTSASVMLDGAELSAKIQAVQEMVRIVPVMASVTVLFIHVSARMDGQVMDVTSLTVLEIQTVQTEVKIFIIFSFIAFCQCILLIVTITCTKAITIANLVRKQSFVILLLLVSCKSELCEIA